MTDPTVVCECSRKVLKSNLSRHRRSRHHEWRMEMRKTIGLQRVSETTKITEILKALGAKTVMLKTKTRHNQYGRIRLLRPAPWVDDFHAEVAVALWMNLPWRKAVKVAEALMKDPARMVLLRLAIVREGLPNERWEILSRMAYEMGFKWKYWDGSWDFRTPDEAEQDEVLTGLTCRR